MKRNYWLLTGVLGSILVSLAAWFLLSSPSSATESDDNTWTAVATTMNQILDNAHTTYQSGDLESARDIVNDAYYSYYEAKGFEKVVMAYISGSSATEAEYEFGIIKTTILAGGPADAVTTHITSLQTMLLDQARRLDGPGASDSTLFVDALTIILREGVEAILVLGAIISYLIKSDQRRHLPTIYAGAGFALAASFLLAAAIGAITSLAGASQEVIEGITILLACAMLIWVSSWMAKKADERTWKRYIQTKTDASIAAGSVLSLAFVAFLAVFREGAEVVLMFQALGAQAGGQSSALWAGAGVGFVGLVGVYIGIRYLSLRLPLRPFFLATSALLALMAFSFAGSGITELQEGDLVGITPVAHIPSIDLLGIHPTVESLVTQAFVLALLVVIMLTSRRRSLSEPVETAANTEPQTSEVQIQNTEGEAIA
ncbi:MAG: FTR1 family iron permease [Propionibacteriaceae bacterium]|nr:FTR1 family iron permease [Propionibacteriaceae bacterium]